jgi:membrane dipeptidase
MNRLGIMIDVAHVSDSTFYQVIRLSKAPIIASHSSCRYFTPGFERNMSDEMIRVLAAHGGVIQINFGSQFVDDTCRVVMERDQKEIREHIVKYKMNPDDSTAHAYVREYWREHPVAMPGVAVVAEHIDHVRKLVGIDYVGLGSDFDGLDGVLPVGLTDVSHYPDLILELMKLGYSERDIAKVCSGNILRVWSAVERVAQKEAKR